MREGLHYQELGISTLTACFINANRDPDKSPPVSPVDYCYFQPATEQISISGAAAGIFFQLIDEEVMPGWVIPISPLEQLEKAANSGGDKATVSPRAWLATNAEILLILPTIIGEDKVRISVGFIGDEVQEGETEFEDIDTQEKFILSIDFNASAWFTDCQFYLVN